MTEGSEHFGSEIVKSLPLASDPLTIFPNRNLMGRSREESSLLKSCAEAFGVSVRSVRNWREAKDRRWEEFLAERARSTTTIIIPGSRRLADDVHEPEQLGTGLEFELVRLRNECLDLARRSRSARASGDLAAEMAINRMLDAKRETLRRMSKDEPDISIASGQNIPKQEVLSYMAEYVSNVVALIQSLPDRISALLPNTAPSVVEAIQQDIDDIRRAARDMKISGVIPNETTP